MSLDIYLYNEVYTISITHNLGLMAREAGLYDCIWRPEESGIYTSELIEPLKKGLEQLKSDPERFKKLNPVNGYGSYEDLVIFVSAYLKQCEANPTLRVEASR